jgi:hypothetical protein
LNTKIKIVDFVPFWNVQYLPFKMSTKSENKQNDNSSYWYR